MTVRRWTHNGAGWVACDEHGRALPGAKVHRQAPFAEGDVVAVLMTINAITNAGKDYENTYAVHFELEDGKIAKQVEIMDFRVSNDKFDLSVLQ